MHDVYLTCLCLMTLVPAAVLGDFLKVCYYSAWVFLRDGPQALQPEDIDAFHCTHLVLAYGTVDDTGKRLQFPDVFEDMHLPERLAALREQKADLSIVLAVGGWQMDSESWHQVMTSNDTMQEFITEAINFLRFHDFDGIDLDWQYPAFRKSTEEDRDKFTEFCEIFRHSIEVELQPDSKWALSLSVSADPSAYRVMHSYEIRRLAKEIDFFTLKTYDLHGHWEEPMAAKHHSPFADDDDAENNIVALVNEWLYAGVPRHQIVLGIAFFGRSFQLQNENMTRYGAPAIGPGSDGGDGIPVNKICHLIRSGVSEIYVPNKKVPYYVMGDDWVGFDNPRSVREKAMLVATEHLGGVALWTLDMDDHKGLCGEKWPLTFSMLHGLGSAEYVDYVHSKQESERELLKKKILYVKKQMTYYADTKDWKNMKRTQNEILRLQDNLSNMQTAQQQFWNQVQNMHTAGGKPMPPLDKPSWA